MVSLIVARSRNNVIGKNGIIPWNIKGEQKQFKELTIGNVVIMGRKTFESIGRPLPNRTNIVVSKTMTSLNPNLLITDSLNNAIKLAGSDREIFIAGGYGLYKEAINIVDKMYITEINVDIKNGDTFFPEFDKSEFDIELLEESEYFKRYLYIRRR